MTNLTPDAIAQKFARATKSVNDDSGFVAFKFWLTTKQTEWLRRTASGTPQYAPLPNGRWEATGSFVDTAGVFNANALIFWRAVKVGYNGAAMMEYSYKGDNAAPVAGNEYSETAADLRALGDVFTAMAIRLMCLAEKNYPDNADPEYRTIEQNAKQIFARAEKFYSLAAKAR